MYTTDDFFGLMKKLEAAKIFFTLERNEENDSVSVIAVVPGQRWRIERFSDGKVEMEKFISNGDMFDEKEIETLFKQIS